MQEFAGWVASGQSLQLHPAAAAAVAAPTLPPDRHRLNAALASSGWEPPLVAERAPGRQPPRAWDPPAVAAVANTGCPAGWDQAHTLVDAVLLPTLRRLLVRAPTVPPPPGPAACIAERRRGSVRWCSCSSALHDYFLCMITPLCSYLYGGLSGGLYERAHIIRYFPPMAASGGGRAVRLRGGRAALAAARARPARPARRQPRRGRGGPGDRCRRLAGGPLGPRRAGAAGAALGAAPHRTPWRVGERPRQAVEPTPAEAWLLFEAADRWHVITFFNL